MAYLTVNQHEITRKIGLAEPEHPMLSSNWETVTNQTNPLSMDDIAVALREKQRREMLPAEHKTHAVVYCSFNQQQKRPVGMVPEIYASTARRLGLNVDHLAEAFGEAGFHVDKCFSAWKGGQSVLEVWKVDLFLSPTEPILKIHFLKHNTYKLLLPDLYLQTLTHPKAVDCFADYSWPNGDRELLDIRHTCCAVESFRNVREPVLFVSDNEERRARLVTILTVVRELAKVQHASRRGNYTSQQVDLPTCVGRADNRDYNEEANDQFAEVLHEAALRLGTTSACAKFWRRYRRTWVFQWSKKRYQKKKYYLTIHRALPHLMFVKRDNKSNDAFTLALDYTSSSLTRGCANEQQKKTWSNFMRNTSHTHMVFVDHMMDAEPRLFFSFETSEDLKDFQQVIATLGYIQLRTEQCAVTPAILSRFMSGSEYDKKSVPDDELFTEQSPQYYKSPLTIAPTKQPPAKQDTLEESPPHVFTKSFEGSFIPQPEGNLSTSTSPKTGVSPSAYEEGTLRMKPRRAPMGSLFSRAPSGDYSDAQSPPNIKESSGSFEAVSKPRVRSLLKNEQTYSSIRQKATDDSGTDWDQAFYSSSPVNRSPIKGQTRNSFHDAEEREFSDDDSSSCSNS